MPFGEQRRHATTTDVEVVALPSNAYGVTAVVGNVIYEAVAELHRQ
jgi:hypothetical protein